MFRTAQSLLLTGLLAGFALTAQAQTQPAQQVEPDHYYIDGQPSTKEAVEALAKKKNVIKAMNVFTGEQAVAHSHDATSKKVVMVTTK